MPTTPPRGFFHPGDTVVPRFWPSDSAPPRYVIGDDFYVALDEAKVYPLTAAVSVTFPITEYRLLERAR